VDPLPYATPAAFRAALTVRLKKLAVESNFAMPELQRQFAYDRLLARAFSSPDADRWVLKGAVSLLARIDISRHSKDVDLAWRPGSDNAEAEQAFRLAVDQDLGDFFFFDLGPAAELADGKGVRMAVRSDLGGRVFSSFSVDLVTGVTMTGHPDRVHALIPLDIPGLVRPDYWAYPTIDHVADKVAACLEVRVRQSGVVVHSTRYKDLVDLVLIGLSETLDAAALGSAIRSELGRRGIAVPPEFMVPESTWAPGYEAKVREVGGLGELMRFEAAIAFVKSIVDHALSNAPHGAWDPALWRWVESTPPRS
jgi:hypothetical protein